MGHNYIAPFVHAIDVSNNPKWADDDFDSIWIINYTDVKAIFTSEKEGLNPADD